MLTNFLRISLEINNPGETIGNHQSSRTVEDRIYAIESIEDKMPSNLIFCYFNICQSRTEVHK